MLTKEQRVKLLSLNTAGTCTESNLESKYAQHYHDDHGRAARAVLMASEREEKEMMSRRQQWNMTNGEAQLNDTVVERRKSRSRHNTSARQEVSNTPQHHERFNVNGKPMSLEEVKHHFEEESESGASYNFDDGISALSAHTLEEMAKAEKMLQRQNRLTKEPQEQGFDVTLEQSSGSVNVPGPPSPTATEESIGSADPCDDTHAGNIMQSKSLHQYDNDKEKELYGRQQRYPLQMARNQSNTGTSYVSSVSIQSSSTDFSDTWKQNDQDYWTQNVQNDSPSKVSIPCGLLQFIYSKVISSIL